MTEAVRGDEGGYVPCNDAAASLPADDADGVAIAGRDGGYAVPGDSPAAFPGTSDSVAITGGGVGFVAKPCECCGGLPGSSGLVDPGDTPGGTHDVIQSSALTLDDTFTRVIPWVDHPTTPGPGGGWYQWGVADSGQQWFSVSSGLQVPAPPDTIEVDGSSILATAWNAFSLITGGQINQASGGGYDYAHYDFGWHLADHGFDVTADVYFEKYGFVITSTQIFSLSVHLAVTDQSSRGMATVAYRIRRSTDPTLLRLSRGYGASVEISLPTLSAFTWYRIRWQVDGPACHSRVRIWPVGDTEPTTWDGEVALLGPMRANATFGAGLSSGGGVAGGLPQMMRLDNIHLTPTNLYGHATVTEDSVAQLGPRQYQLLNSYLPGTIAAFIEHAGYPLVTASPLQVSPNIVEDDPVAGIFSFPASIDYIPTYNPTITTGTVVTAAYIVPPNC